MPESSYCCAELEQPVPWEIPSPQLGRLSPDEKCLVFRMHLGMSQAHLADLVGVSRYWLGLMERGLVNCDRLVRYWRSHILARLDAIRVVREAL